MKRVVSSILTLGLLLLVGFNCSRSTTSDLISVQLPFHSLKDEKDLDHILDQAGNARIVLLGEASHGTAEYYNWRASLTRQLIQQKGFGMIAVEGEWADSYRVNGFIKGTLKDSLQAVALLRQYDRWPTWMWGNYEVASLVTWLNQYNQSKPAPEKVGFYGMDVYCLWESMAELMPYIRGVDSMMNRAQQVNQCFQPYSSDPMDYAYAVAYSSANCMNQTAELWKSVLNATGGNTAGNETQFVMQQNALVAFNGEQYYRSSASNYACSWNIRDRHMTQTIQRLLDFQGPDSKIIIWAHNTHVGDARFTDMAGGGMVNVGQLVREAFGRDNVYIVGFGSYSGTVVAAGEWGGPIETMRVPPARKGSWEEALHRAGAENKILLSSELRQMEALKNPVGHRAIGVQYDPARETGNYVPSVIPERYDAFIFLDRTTALRPISIPLRNEPPDTYPSGY